MTRLHRLMRSPQAWLILLPVLYATAMLLGPWVFDSGDLYGGTVAQASGRLVPGASTIDPNIGVTSYALGVLAVRELLHGHLPLWNHFEGFGQPLLGELQSAALFPPTLLLGLRHGQLIEHVALQILGGLGMLALLRLQGFRPKVCLSLAICFEFCSLFVWLKNAMVNPIPFLIWTLVYGLRLARKDLGRPWLADALGLGIAAGCAVLGGFPETVLIFSVFAALWILWCLPRAAFAPRRLGALALSVSVSVAVGLGIGGALLVALLAFAPVAYFGVHLQTAFLAEAHLGLHSALKYLLPYLSGPIEAYAADDEIGGMGGYTGIVLPVLALVGLVCPGRRRERVLWAGLAIACIATSHGFRPIQHVVMMLPGFSTTAFFRQANVVWLVALFCLAAHALDRIRDASAARLAGAGAAGAVLLALLIRRNGGWLLGLIADPDVLPWLVGSALAASILVHLTVWSIHGRTPRLATVMILGETLAMFLVPVLSLPTQVDVDQPTIGYLQQHSRLDRSVNLGADVLTPNFGSAWSIRQLNFDDLPVPAATVEFIHARLDPMYPTWATNYVQGFPPDPDGSRLRHMKRHLSDYARVGVRYVLAAPNALDLRSAIRPGSNVPRGLAAGDTVSFHVEPPAGSGEAPLTGDLGVGLATYDGTSDGDLDVAVCRQGADCIRQTFRCAEIENNATLTLAAGVSLSRGVGVDVMLTKVGGQVPLVVWAYLRQPARDDALSVEGLTVPGADGGDRIPDVTLASDVLPGLRRVLRGAAGDVFELDEVWPYVSARDCRVTALGFDRASADCERPSELERLELWMPGWHASVDGADVPVLEAGPFQRVPLGPGHHVIAFDYDPYHLRIFCILTLVCLIVCPALWLGVTIRDRRRLRM